MTPGEYRLIAYLGGPMRGYEHFNLPAHLEAEKELLDHTDLMVQSAARMDLEAGFDPYGDGPDNQMLRQMIQRDCVAITRSDLVLMLPGWEKSDGCFQEMILAQLLNIPCYEVSDQMPDCRAIIQRPSDIEDLGLGCPISVEVRDAPEEEEHESILHEAYHLTRRSRNESYGPPEVDHWVQAGMLNKLFHSLLAPGKQFEPHHMGMIMNVVKLSRAMVSPEKKDHFVDGSGYWDCSWRCVRKYRLSGPLEERKGS